MSALQTGLARRLFPDAAETAERLALGASTELLERQLADCVQSSTAWPALADLLRRIVDEKLPTLIYGDYDVDGSVSAFLLFRWLRSQGVPGNIFLPSRFKHGYGLDSTILQEAPTQGYKALLALDCGTTNLEEVRIARAGGLLAGIIDHHMPKAELPDAVLLNPHLESALPPLCTAGLVYACLCTLAGEGQGSLAGDELELAGMATVADIVPLVPLSWAMAHHATLRMPATTNLGLAELIKVSKLHGLDRITGRQISFDLVPRLNAAGRMLQARIIPNLFLADSSDAARRVALHLNALNEERRETGRRVTDQANAQALSFAGSSALVVYDQDWHVGVLGIVAARLAETHCMPVIVLSAAPGAEGLLSGSVRSHGGVDVAAALALCGESLESFGGHAMAAGVKVRADRLDALRDSWGAAVLELRGAADLMAPEESGPAGAAIGELTEQFEQDIWALAPFGPQHPVPVLKLEGCYLHRMDHMGSARTHIRMQVGDNERQVRVAGFNMSHLYHRLKLGERIEPIVHCEPDNWNNRCTILLKLISLET